VPGDRAELPVVVRNETDAALAVDLAMRGIGFTSSPAVAPSGAGAHARAEARSRSLADSDGDAQFQVVARAGDLTDAAAFSVPIRAEVS